MNDRDELIDRIRAAITTDSAWQESTDDGMWDSGSAQFRWGALASHAADAAIAAGWRLPTPGQYVPLRGSQIAPGECVATGGHTWDNWGDCSRCGEIEDDE